MPVKPLHPADQIVQAMNRIYENKMTTTSGGNLSILDENGDIWITPSGIDKGGLTREDICRVDPAGKVYGRHAPSVELPFHAAIYKRRPGLRAVLHAHPPALVAFSLARALPDIRLVSSAFQTLGKLTMAAYAVPGSQALGDRIAAQFQQGFDIVMLENHGVVVGAQDMLRALMLFETLESTASMEICARKLGKPRSLGDSQLKLAAAGGHPAMDSFLPGARSAGEEAARREMIRFIRRACRQGLFTSTQGTCSLRLSDDRFLITPFGLDCASMEEEDLVLMESGRKERGKTPSRAVGLHQKIYALHAGIRAVMGASPPHAMAFAVTEEAFDPRTIPESYLMLRQSKKIPFEDLYLKQDEVAAMLCDKTPALILENDQALATGDSLLKAFDRLEVMEATAKSILAARDIGPLVRISQAEVADIDRAFNL